MSSHWLSDLLVVFAGSALFWLTLAGMAFRTFRIDANEVETRLKQLYDRADAARLSVIDVSARLSTTTLSALFGPRGKRAISRVAATALVLSVFSFAIVTNDWERRRVEIEALEREIILAVDPEYYDRATDETRRALMEEAFETIPGGGKARAPRYVHNDEAAVAERARWRAFRERYDRYVTEHRLSYEAFLSESFGRGLAASSSSRADQEVGRWIVIFLNATTAALIDYIAIMLLFRVLSDLAARRLALVFAGILGIAACFSASLFTFASVFAGEGGRPAVLLMLSAMIVAVPLGVGALLIRGGATHDADRRKAMLQSVALMLLMLIPLALVLPDAVRRMSEDFLRLWVRVMDVGIQAHGIAPLLFALQTLLPTILVISIVLSVFAVNAVFATGKAIILGQIHGTSVLAGGTYLAAVITTLTLCTAFAVLVWRLINQ